MRTRPNSRTIAAVQLLEPRPASADPARTELRRDARKADALIDGIRCDGYTTTWPPIPTKPNAALTGAGAARLRAAETGGRLKATPAARSARKRDPIAQRDGDRTAVNRRVVVTFVHRIGVRKSNARV
jgi:hypothetical protein